MFGCNIALLDLLTDGQFDLASDFDVLADCSVIQRPYCYADGYGVLEIQHTHGDASVLCYGFSWETAIPVSVRLDDLCLPILAGKIKT